MKLKVWGARGSVPAPGPEMNRYGGNTSCVELELSDGSTLILDAGTGIRSLGVGIAANAAEGQHPPHPPAPGPHPGPDVLRALLPVASPRSRSGARPRPRPRSRSGSRATSRPPSPPSRSASSPARSPSSTPPRASGRSARPRSAPRPSPTAGPPSATGSPTATRTLTYISDHEPGLGAPLETLEPEWISGYDLARDADLLIHDCQYTDEEYPDHVGWGHSKLTDTLTFARRVEAKRLMLFHHDPLHSDDFLDRFSEAAVERWVELGGEPTRSSWPPSASEVEVTAPAPAPALT